MYPGSNSWHYCGIKTLLLRTMHYAHHAAWQLLLSDDSLLVGGSAAVLCGSTATTVQARRDCHCAALGHE